VLTIRAATTLLATANSLDALTPIARALGFVTTPLHTSRDTRNTLAIGDFVTSANLLTGPGHMRLITAQLGTAYDADSNYETKPLPDSRELTRQLCNSLARNAPAQLWCVITLDAPGNMLCIACVAAHPHGPRVAALRVDRRRIVDSDADTLRALAAAPREHDRLCHARWIDILKRDALSARFYRTLDRLVHAMAKTATGAASHTERVELALLCTSRLLFLAFLEAKGWLNGDRGFLLTHCSQQLEAGGKLHERFLKPLFFGTLNTPIPERAPSARTFGEVPFLNGGLFAPTKLEQRRRTLRFTDDALTAVIGELLDRFRFTAREDSSTWSEAAVDPEMLGRAFECLMATDERRKSGSFYTPPALVEQTVHDALRAALPALPDEAFTNSDCALALSDETLEHIRNLHIIDPACGSGAFLVHTLERISTLQARAGDARPLHTIRRETLTHSIFGVDRNPLAVWLCELRLWLSVVIECPETEIRKIPPLPNLDHHIHAGDTLTGGDLRFASRSARVLASLRQRYTRATGARKRTLAGQLEREERARAIAESTRMVDSITNERCELLQVIRRRDLFGERTPPTRANTLHLLTLRSRLREQRALHHRLSYGGALPFRFASHFADVAANGFDLVIGNPPWIRPHNLPLAERTRLRTEYKTLREAAWRGGANRAGAGAGFSAQADLAAAFVERSITLLKPAGVIALLLPAKLWRALAGGGVRRFVATHTHIHTIRDWSDAHALFDAAVYPSLLVATRTASVDSDTNALTTRPAHINVAIARKHEVHTFALDPHSLAMGADPAAPWILLPTPARAAFERLRNAGPALGDSHLGRPLLGVKCGLNSAFLVHATEHDDDTATIHSDGHDHTIERLLLRPALRGDGIAERLHPTAPHSTRNAELRILWTHGADGTPLRTLPPRTSRWLARYRPLLETRRDSRAKTPWWSLFRTEAARYENARLVWADLGKRLRTIILPPGDPTVPLNSCYVLRAPSLEDAFALNALLTSPLTAAWLDAIAEPARGGWRRFLGWTVAALPVPHDWTNARTHLAELGRRQTAGIAISSEEHTEITAEAYNLPLSSLTPLLDWFAR
jgi:hypothetical protein